jgi:hypothetical protein
MIRRLRRLVLRALLGDVDAAIAAIDSPEFAASIQEQANEMNLTS